MGAFQKSEKRIRHICLPVRMKQLSSNWTDFHEIWYLSIYPKFVGNQTVLKSNKNNGYFSWRLLYNYDNISLNS
jgi:hypothetical protein